MNGLLIVNAFLKNGKFGALYDLLADAVRAGLNMEFVYRVLRKEI